MFELSISASGEVKLDYETVGQIERATSVSHLSVTGEWVRDAGCVDPYEFADLEDERDILAHKLDEAKKKIERLKCEIHKLRRPDTVAT